MGFKAKKIRYTKKCTIYNEEYDILKNVQYILFLGVFKIKLLFFIIWVHDKK